jgi:hypothetical protein
MFKLVKSKRSNAIGAIIKNVRIPLPIVKAPLAYFNKVTFPKYELTQMSIKTN